MISPEILRRYPFFSCFSHVQLDELALAAGDLHVAAEHRFFAEGESLTHFFLLQEGAVALTIKVPDRKARQTVAMHVMGDFITREVAVGNLGKHDVFGWSALIPPNESTAGAQALVPCHVISFDTRKLRPALQKDCGFRQLLTLKAAQILRERLRMRRIESLVDDVEYA
jgi:CRP-like cAMP-binding protein